jgi:uncharacterized repeat protein (TIGR03803 family)
MKIRPDELTTYDVLFGALLSFAGHAAAQAPSLSTIYEFKGAPDGANPSSGLVADIRGVLYGTTSNGGLFPSSEPYATSGCGIVFSLTPPVVGGSRWTETILHSFEGGSDGCGPTKGVVFGRGGLLYGTTSNSIAGGTAFELTPPTAPGGPWNETVIHTFAGGPNDAGAPIYSLAVGRGGVLYGTGFYGGDYCWLPSDNAFGCGAVFALAPPTLPGGAWTEAMVYSIGALDDGPSAGVAIGSGGVLYGVTQYGGGPYGGPGTVFSLAPPSSAGGLWNQTILSNFVTSDGINDGSVPAVPVVVGPGGILYGTTSGGGMGSGEVYSLAPPSSPGDAWTYTVLYAPPSVPGHNSAPNQLTLGKDGILYSTFSFGGASYSGEIFSLTPPTSPSGSWTETILYTFNGTGYSPNGGLLIGPDGLLCVLSVSLRKIDVLYFYG